jgi:hypothetical protein
MKRARDAHGGGEVGSLQHLLEERMVLVVAIDEVHRQMALCHRSHKPRVTPESEVTELHDDVSTRGIGSRHNEALPPSLVPMGISNQ